MLPPSLYTLLNFDMRPLHLFVLVCGLASSSLAQERPFDANRFEATELATELVRPMELDVADDGRVFFIELGGKLKVLQPGKSSVELVGELLATEQQDPAMLALLLSLPSMDYLAEQSPHPSHTISLMKARFGGSG